LIISVVNISAKPPVKVKLKKVKKSLSDRIRGKMFWTVRIKFTYKGEPIEATYTEDTVKRSLAVHDALDKFISENKLTDPATKRLFRPYHLQNKLRNICEISAKCSEDGRIRE
jgi:hypothetical protein